jgi:hypothetical protein
MNLNDLLIRKSHVTHTPTIVCLCGSTRFGEAFADANLYETLKGNIVLSIGCNTKSDDDIAKAGIVIDKEALDLLHLHKIDLADEVLFLNVGGYMGESTCRELAFATMKGKIIRFLEPDKAPKGDDDDF